MTQGTGFSLSEVCLSPQPIEYTGMESPDVIILASADGLRELRANGALARTHAETLLVMDGELEPPLVEGRAVRLELRRAASPPRAVLAGIAAWLTLSPILPPAAWHAALGTLPPDRRGDAQEALAIGRKLVAQSGQGGVSAA